MLRSPEKHVVQNSKESQAQLLDQREHWVGIIHWQVKDETKGQPKEVQGVIVENHSFRTQVLTGSAGFIWLYMLPLTIT